MNLTLLIWALLANFGENAWRLMMGVAVFIPLLYSPFSLALVESPRWLITLYGTDRNS